MCNNLLSCGHMTAGHGLPDVWMIWSAWCGCSHLAEEAWELSSHHLNNGHCWAAALSSRCGDREGVSSGDAKVTGSLCCCGNLELDTAVDIGLLGKWSDTSNGEASNIYLRLFFSPAWQSGNSRGLRMALGPSLRRLSWVTLLKSRHDKTSVVMINTQAHLGVKKQNKPKIILTSNTFIFQIKLKCGIKFSYAVLLLEVLH